MADELIEKASQNIPVKAGGFTQITNVPMPTKEEGQRSINITDLFITRWTPPWSRPPSLPAYTWRAWVLNQPVATVCKEVLIEMLTGLDWNITARNSDNKRDLESTIEYYTKLFNKGGYYLDTDWTGFLEWVCGDLLDIPFGGATEIGRKDDSPKGRVIWLRPLDGGTLYPTLNHDYPVVQYYQGYTAVAFPKENISRMYIAPRQEIFREGWGLAPPEKIYFALDLLNRGDKYYANLLLDIPPAGILDLGDMEASSAKEWISEFKTFIANTTDAFRIPVLYEHNNEVKFMPFGKAPNDIMYDHITLKYAALVAAAYGLQLNDIGLQTTARSGETLAGAIRGTTQTMRTGMARMKMKVKFFLEHILPDSLQFDWVDYNADLNVAMGRARLASSTAFNLMVTAGALSPEEYRAQMMFDGLLDISIPNEPPKDAVPQQPNSGNANGKAPEHPGVLGHGTLPSEGGEGESRSLVIRKSLSSDIRVEKTVSDLLYALSPKIEELLHTISDDDLVLSKSIVTDGLLENKEEILQILSAIVKSKSIITIDSKSLKSLMGEVTGVPDGKKEEVKKKLRGNINNLISQSIVKHLSDVLWELQVSQVEDFEMNWDENSEDVFDDGIKTNYDYIVGEVKSRTLNSLPATLTKWVENELYNK